MRQKISDFIRRVKYPEEYAEMMSVLDDIEELRERVGRGILDLQDGDSVDREELIADLETVQEKYDRIFVLSEVIVQSERYDDDVINSTENIREMAENQVEVYTELQNRVEDGEEESIDDEMIARTLLH